MVSVRAFLAYIVIGVLVPAAVGGGILIGVTAWVTEHVLAH